MSKKWKCPHCGSDEIGYEHATDGGYCYCKFCGACGPISKTKKGARREFCRPRAFKDAMEAKRQEIAGPRAPLEFSFDADSAFGGDEEKAPFICVDCGGDAPGVKWDQLQTCSKCGAHFIYALSHITPDDWWAISHDVTIAIAPESEEPKPLVDDATMRHICAWFLKETGKVCAGVAMDADNWWVAYEKSVIVDDDSSQWFPIGLCGVRRAIGRHCYSLPTTADVSWRESWVPNPDL